MDTIAFSSSTIVLARKFDLKKPIRLFGFMKRNFSGVSDISDIIHVEIRWTGSIVI